MNYGGESIVIIVLVAFFDSKKKKKHCEKHCILKSFDRLVSEPGHLGRTFSVDPPLFWRPCTLYAVY